MIRLKVNFPVLINCLHTTTTTVFQSISFLQKIRSLFLFSIEKRKSFHENSSMQHVIIVFPGHWRLIRDMLKETQSLDVITKQILYCKSSSLSSYNASALQRELNFQNGHLSLLYFCPNLSVFYRNRQLKSGLYSWTTALIFFHISTQF